MKTMRVGSRSSCSSNHALRRVHRRRFARDPATLEEPPHRADGDGDAALHSSVFSSDSRVGLALIHAECRRGGWLAWVRALSVDLSRRVVGAIERGLSFRAAAERFGVSLSSAIRCRAQEQREGDVTPKRQGGDRHSHRFEAHAELILSASAAKSNVTLAELRNGLK